MVKKARANILSPFAETWERKLADGCEEISASEGFRSRRSSGEKIPRSSDRGASLPGEQDIFWSPTKGKLTIFQVIKEVSDFVNEDSESMYRVVIGTDSQAKRINGDSEIDFVSAIVVHRIGRGGRYFWNKERQKKNYVLRDKIYTETLMSLQLAERVVPELRKVIPASKYDLEIHIDVGPVGPTRDMIKEVVGMVVGSGYTAKTKPESYGASAVADRHT